MYMLQSEGVRKAGDGIAGGTAQCAEVIPWNVSEKFYQSWQLWSREILAGHPTQGRTRSIAPMGPARGWVSPECWTC